MNKMMDQSSKMMNKPPLTTAPLMSQPLPPVMSQNQVINPIQLNQNPIQLNQPPMMMMMNQNQRGYKPWQQQQQPSISQQLPNHPFNNNMIGNNFVPSKPRTNRNNWKGKNINNKDQRRMDGNRGYKPPSLNELQNQNRMKARKYYHPKKKFNNRLAPYAPRNTTSFIIRAKKAGGIASLVSPCPVTPAVLPTPIFSPSREVLGDMAKEEWGVDGYGSMKGLIRLRSPGNDADLHDEDEDEEGNGSSESDVEEHVEVERRLDHDLSRFEMIYPSSYGGDEYSYNNVLENRVDDQDTHIAQLEEENLTLKEKLFLMERELGDLRRRMQFLERQQRGRTANVVVDVNEEVVENVSEHESDGGSDIGATADEGNEVAMECVDGNVSSDVKEICDVRMDGSTTNHGKTMRDNHELKKGAGEELVVNLEVIEKADEVKGEQMRNEVVMEKAIAEVEEFLNKDDSSGKVVLETVVEKDNNNNNNKDGESNVDMAMTNASVEKDDHKSKELNKEMSIGSGD